MEVLNTLCITSLLPWGLEKYTLYSIIINPYFLDMLEHLKVHTRFKHAVVYKIYEKRAVSPLHESCSTNTV